MSTTSDPRFTHGADTAPKALALSDEDRAKGYVRPVRASYRHTTCGAVTTMDRAIAETYARAPHIYGATYCVCCRMYRPVGEHGEFEWLDGSKMGT